MITLERMSEGKRENCNCDTNMLNESLLEGQWRRPVENGKVGGRPMQSW